MTLPNLSPCPKPDCRAPITHWHNVRASVACRFVLNGKPCLHDDPACYAPRETSPLHLPDVDAVARVIYESDSYPTTRWATELEGVKDDYRRNARDVLDLIAAHQPVWQRVEPGTLIKAGTRCRRASLNDSFWERIAAGDFLTGDGTYFIDTRTIPAEPEDPRVAVVTDWLDTLSDTGEGVSDLLARLDAMGGEQS